jgi:uncharacterized iron-regulated membrane protein
MNRKASRFVELAFIHRWAGALAGPPLHVMFVAGALTLFNRSLMTWEEPLAQSSAQFSSYQALLDAVAPVASDFHLYLPEQGRGHPSIAYPPPDGHGWQGFWIEPHGGAVPRRENLAGFLYDLHFFWHAATGYWLQNLGGLCLVAFLLAVASGAWLATQRVLRLQCAHLAHPTRPAFVSPLGRVGARLTLAARALSVVYAYTGALMVLSPLLVAASVGHVFAGDLPRALDAAGYFGEELAEEVEESPGPAAQPLPLDQLVASALAVEPGLRLDSFAGHNYGHDNGVVEVRGSLASGPAFSSQLKRNTSVRVRSADGVVLGATAVKAGRTTAEQAGRWLQGIHHTLYAGIALRLLLLPLLLVGSCAFLFYNWRWLQRSAPSGTGRWGRQLLERWTLGVGAGTFVAVSALFLASRLLPLDWAPRGSAEELVFVGSLGTCIAWALVTGDGVRCCARQLRLAGFLLLPVPALAARWSGAGLFGGGEHLGEVVGVDVAISMLSLTWLALSALVNGAAVPEASGSLPARRCRRERVGSRSRSIERLAAASASVLCTVPVALLAAAAGARFAPLREDTRFIIALLLVIPLWVASVCAAGSLGTNARKGWVGVALSLALVALLR